MPEIPLPYIDEINENEKRKKRELRASLGPSKEIIKFIEKYRDEFKPGDEVLELGVGEGRNLEAFKGLDLQLHGIEIDPEAVEICNQNLLEKGIKADIQEGSFTDLSAFKDESIQTIFSQYAVQNAKTWKDIEHVFGEIRRVLKPSGLYLFREQKNPFIEEIDRKKRVGYFTENELKELAEQYNFEIVEGEVPQETGDDSRRVDNKQVVWNMVLRKNKNS